MWQNFTQFLEPGKEDLSFLKIQKFQVLRVFDLSYRANMKMEMMETSKYC